MKKPPKVLQLVKILSKEELNLIKKRLKQSNQKRLLKLVEHLSKIANQPVDKKTVYEYLFEDEYSSKKDYLIRNEYRLLSQRIERLLAELDLQEQLNNQKTLFHFHLLEALQKRKAYDLFQKEYTESYKQALAQKDYYAAFNITELNFIHFAHFQNLKKKDWSQLENLNKLGLQHLSSYYLTAFRQYQIHHQYIHSSLFAYSTETELLEKEIIINFENHKTIYSNYLYLKAKSFIVPLKDQENILHQCLEIAEHHFSKNHLLFEEEVKFCLSALAKNCTLLTQFEAANQYYQRYFEVAKEKDTPQVLFVMSDYIANQINLNQIGKAIQLLTETMPYANSIPKSKLRWQCLKTACYAFEENREELENSLTTKIELPDVGTKYFFRFYYAILASLENRKQDAYREMENLRHLTSVQEDELKIHAVVNLFHRYFYTLMHHPKTIDKLHENNISRLRRAVEDFGNTASPELRSYLPFLWLKRKLRKK